MTRHSVSSQAVRYVLVGLLIYAIDISVYALIVWFYPDYYIAANLLSRITSAVVGFFLHRNFTFSWDHEHGLSRQVVSYLLLLGFNLLLSSVALFFLVDVLDIAEIPGKLITDAMVIVVAFVASRLLVFGQQRNSG